MNSVTGTSKRDPRATLALLGVVIGILLKLFVHPAAQFWLNTVHAISGFCIGLSATISLFLLWQKKRRVSPTMPLD